MHILTAQEANSKGGSISPGKPAKQPLAPTSNNFQQQIKKRNGAAKKKLQEDLEEQTVLVAQLQQQLKMLRPENAAKVRRLEACNSTCVLHIH